MLEKAIEIVAKKIFDEIYAVGRSAVFPEEQSIAEVLTALDEIKEMLELQMAAPLRAGMQLARLDRWSDALPLLAQAEAVDPLSAMAKLWLSTTLVRLGRGGDALPLIRRALAINPFITDANWPKFEAPFSSWSRELLATDIGAQLPPRKFLHGFVDQLEQRASTGIRAVSTSGQFVVVQWILGGDLKYEPEEYISAFDTHKGTAVWTIDSTGFDLIVATPAIVACLPRSDLAKPMILFDTATGRILRRPSRAYFTSIFGPLASCRRAEHHATMLTPSDAYNHTWGERYKGLRGFWREITTGQTHNGTELRESIVRPLLLYSDVELVASNNWSHAHVYYGEGLAVCGLWGDAELATQPASNRLTILTS